MPDDPNRPPDPPRDTNTKNGTNSQTQQSQQQTSSSSSTTASDPARRPPPSQDSAASNPSMTSRIQSSASGLLHNTILGGGGSGSREGDDVSATLAASLAEKGGSSRAGGGAGGPSHVPHAPTGSGIGRGRVGETFRSSSASGAASTRDANQAYGAGMDLGPVDDPAMTLGGANVTATAAATTDGMKYDYSLESDQNLLGQRPPRQPTAEHTSPQFEQAWQRTGSQDLPPSISAATTTSAGDGQAVSTLLSDPSFDPLSHPVDGDGTENDLDPDDTPNPYIPQASQQRGTTSHTATNTSLVPDIDTLLASSASAPSTAARPDMDLSNLSSLLPASDQPWLSLDALYHDAVYGNMLEPYIEDARREVQQQQKQQDRGPEDGEGPALRRLRLVLGHVREREMGKVEEEGKGKERAS